MVKPLYFLNSKALFCVMMTLVSSTSHMLKYSFPIPQKTEYI